MQSEISVRGRPGAWMRLGVENALTTLVYWAFAHAAFIVFQKFGILPMPVWPSAAVAIVTAFYRGWSIAPGIAAGTICANYFSLGGSWEYAVSLSLMNTVGPLLGASIMRRRVSARYTITSHADLLVCFLAVYLLPPILAASGGMGFKYLFGLVPADHMLTGWIKWIVAHSLGTLLFATPVFVWLAFKEPRNE